MAERQPDVGQTVIEDLCRMIVDELDVRLPPQDVSADTALFDGGLELDSFAVVELINLIEQAFGFEFSEADLCPESFVDVSTLAAVVKRNADRASSP